MSTGDTVFVSAEHGDGWWEGTTGSGSDKHTGFFPRSHVVRRDSGCAPKMPPRPSHLASISESVEDSNSSSSGSSSSSGGGGVTMGHLEYEKSVALGQQFSLDSLELFDELMDRGYAIDFKTRGDASLAVAAGMRVEISCKAMTWDGAATVVHGFGEGNISFDVDRCETVPAGLAEAVGKMTVGSRALVTCTPIMGYGEAGNPPNVKPNSHIVFDVTVVKAEPAGTETPVEGPAEMLKTAVQTPMHKLAARRGSARVASVVLDASTIDDALIAQAVANGLNLSSASK